MERQWPSSICGAWKADVHLPVGIRGPSEDKAAGDELRDDSGTKALRSSEQSGLAGSFSILAHYFPTSSASFQTSWTWTALSRRKKKRQESTVSSRSFETSLRGEGRRVRVIQSHRRDLKLWMAACSTESGRCCLHVLLVSSHFIAPHVGYWWSILWTEVVKNTFYLIDGRATQTPTLAYCPTHVVNYSFDWFFG